MEENEDMEYFCTDNKGNEMKLSLVPQEKYPTRFVLKFYFNNKLFKLQNFGSWRDAFNLWDLLEMLPKPKGKK